MIIIQYSAIKKTKTAVITSKSLTVLESFFTTSFKAERNGKYNHER